MGIAWIVLATVAVAFAAWFVLVLFGFYSMRAAHRRWDAERAARRTHLPADSTPPDLTSPTSAGTGTTALAVARTTDVA